MNTQTLSTGNISAVAIGTSINTNGNFWFPELIETRVYSDSIEQIFKETSQTVLAVYPPRPSEQRVYKIIYSCKDGKWHVSEKIYGSIVPTQHEYYDFE